MDVKRSIRTLLDFFEEAVDGASKIVFLKGYSGVGKSSLLNAIQQPVIKQGSLFITGKFDEQYVKLNQGTV